MMLQLFLKEKDSKEVEKEARKHLAGSGKLRNVGKITDSFCSLKRKKKEKKTGYIQLTQNTRCCLITVGLTREEVRTCWKEKKKGALRQKNTQAGGGKQWKIPKTGLKGFAINLNSRTGRCGTKTPQRYQRTRKRNGERERLKKKKKTTVTLVC